MPLILSSYSPSLLNQIQNYCNRLIEVNAIPFPANTSGIPVIGLIIDIQQITDYRRPEVKKSDPEGLRVFIEVDSKIVAALDFFYVNGEPKYSHAISGKKLDQFINAINFLLMKYKVQKTNLHFACLYFHFAVHPFLITYSEKRTRIYTFRDEELLTISSKELKRRLTDIYRTRKPIIEIT